MKRRNFISITTLGAAAVSLPFLNCNKPDAALDKKLAIPQTLASITDNKTIKEIGKSYCNIPSGNCSIKSLEEQLQQNHLGITVSSNASQKDIYSFINDSINYDFESGNSVVVNGWVLSLTEARQCALYSLIY